MKKVRPSEILFANDNYILTETACYKYSEVVWNFVDESDYEAYDKWGLV